jgi:hypothetical protein
MVHAGISHGAHTSHIIAGYVGALQECTHKFIGGLCHLTPKCLRSARGFGKGNARNQICAVNCLRVECACRVSYQSRIAIYQIRHKCGGADIQSYSKSRWVGFELRRRQGLGLALGLRLRAGLGL